MTTSEESLRYWLALLRAPGVGPVAIRELLEEREPRELFAAGGLAHLGEPLREALRSPDWSGVDADLAWLGGAAGRAIITLRDAAYPALLQELHDAPPLLFVQGSVEALASPQLAIVGSRNPTTVGSETARDFARHLAGMGLTITSGLALGIDAASHRGALDAKGQTIAVMGTGVDRVYPAAHRDLAHAIVAGGGALVSEYPPGTPPLPGNFPRRNRIISGLSLGTLVVEAARQSGSLITARLAGEQGREVFAIPGSIHNPLARGCHQLIRDGARLVETAQDVLAELAPRLHGLIVEALGKGDGVGTAGEDEEHLDEEYRQLLLHLGDEATPVDRLVERSGLTAEVVSSMLLILELRGLITPVPGGYSRTRTRK
ncbi:MAG TPA: DNA-processing protein DprA [Gammaproteobacteria bacterium]